MATPSEPVSEQAAPQISDEQLVARVGELIGAGIEMHYRPHKCNAALDSACATCQLVGGTIAPVVVAAALASREAEVRRPVLLEIHEERIRQHAKWGEQSHPDGTGPSLILCDLPAYQNAVRADHLALWAGQRCKNAPNDGGDTYERILTEEWAEAIAESDPQALRAELVQVAAVAVQWIESIDRRSQL